ncbi:PREDICTED: protein bicaudal D homolog 2-like [Branchiostoma belcheri]|uniref:Protein bicaudal D homolog 2-like n=1 Tax=Branchiostoma belcheri TaxID=7741 RepID=A0A6P4ZEV8_BRABE|nr:PREDICTED: protein bicaudal D homolog 2-like [Branchiostoma belcheri]
MAAVRSSVQHASIAANMAQEEWMPGSLEELQLEVVRLRQELDQATQEKIQAAEYGLQMLEERGLTSQQYGELESVYESTNRELDFAKKSLEDLHLRYQKLSQDSQEREETLLKETATREAGFVNRIASMEEEVRHSKQALTNIKSENDRLARLKVESDHTIDSLENQRKELKENVKEHKQRETRLMQDYRQLEEDNLLLKKQMSILKSSQVEQGALKIENKRLLEDIELVNSQLKEESRVKQVAQKQLEEALNTLDDEREQKMVLQQQVDSLTSNHKIPTTPDSPRIFPSPRQSPTPVTDFLSEFRTSEIEMLNEQLEKIKTEKETLLKTLEEANGKVSQAENYNKKLEAEKLRYQDSNNTIHKELQTMTEELKHIYKTALMINGKRLSRIKEAGRTPTKEKQPARKRSGSKLESKTKQHLRPSGANTQEPSGIDGKSQKNKAKSLLGGHVEGKTQKPDSKVTDPITCHVLLHTTKDQIKQVRRTVDRTLDITSQLSYVDSSMAAERLELQEQVQKLKTLLNSKREQVASLRTVLKVSKAAAETELTTLQQSFNTSRDRDQEELGSLWEEVQELREEVANFHTLRTGWASRCDDLVAQVEEMQDHVAALETEKNDVLKRQEAAEKERKELEAALMAAVQQKVELEQKLEDYLDQFNRLKRSGARISSTINVV